MRPRFAASILLPITLAASSCGGSARGRTVDYDLEGKRVEASVPANWQVEGIQNGQTVYLTPEGYRTWRQHLIDLENERIKKENTRRWNEHREQRDEQGLRSREARQAALNKRSPKTVEVCRKAGAFAHCERITREEFEARKEAGRQDKIAQDEERKEALIANKASLPVDLAGVYEGAANLSKNTKPCAWHYGSFLRLQVDAYGEVFWRAWVTQEIPCKGQPQREPTLCIGSASARIEPQADGTLLMSPTSSIRTSAPTKASSSIWRCGGLKVVVPLGSRPEDVGLERKCSLTGSQVDRQEAQLRAIECDMNKPFANLAEPVTVKLEGNKLVIPGEHTKTFTTHRQKDRSPDFASSACRTFPDLPDCILPATDP